MSTLSQFGGSQPTRAIVNGFSSGGVSAGNLAANPSINGAREVLSGALTANTLTTLVTISQGGQIPFLSIYSKNATSRTLRLVVICDGVTVFDATSNAVTAASSGMYAAASVGAGLTDGGAIRFNSSCVIRVASSLTETDNVAIAYKLI